jgi:hypothetical protein
VWRAKTTRIAIHHAAHRMKSTPSRTSRTRLSPTRLTMCGVRWSGALSELQQVVMMGEAELAED